MTFRLVRELADDNVPVAVACRVLKVSESGYFEWRSRPPSARDHADAELISVSERCTTLRAGPIRRVRAELRLGRHLPVGYRRVARLMRLAGLQGVHHRLWRSGGTGRLPGVFEDRVQRRFTATGPDQLWVTDITQHRTGEGWVHCAAVIDVFSRRCVGWSIADHLRTELVIDALDMARWRRHPTGAIVHSDRGTQYTSRLFGARMREAVLLGSMGKVASSLLTGYSTRDPRRRHAVRPRVRRAVDARVQHVSHDGQGSPAARAA